MRMATVSTTARVQRALCSYWTSTYSSTDACVLGLRLAVFVISRLQIRMLSYPSRGDKVAVETWWDTEGKAATRHDWRLRNADTGEVLGEATR